ncbi:MAG: cullin [Mycoplasma sp.]|nr:cullin [Mycoplasma sp.]
MTFNNALGKFDLDVTAFQMAVLFACNQRPHDRITFENLRLATELSDAELRRTLWVGFIRFYCFFLIYSFS